MEAGSSRGLDATTCLILSLSLSPFHVSVLLQQLRGLGMCVSS